jgi:hypothetical protein
MDWGSLPELANHFTQAASVFTTHLNDMTPPALSDSARNIFTALFTAGAMTMPQKSFQGVKFAAATGTLIASIATDNVSGIVGSLIAEGEVFYDLEKAGEEFRRGHHGADSRPAPEGP